MNTTRIGALLLLVQPIDVLVELVVVSLATTPYDLVGHTISDLGALGCGQQHPYPGAPGPVCSPASPWLNTSFVVFGAAMAVGIVLVRRRARLGPGAVALWAISGVSSIATGFAPVDVVPALHLLVSTPVFLAQPVALVLTGRASDDRVAVVLGVASITAALAFILGLTSGLDGLLERAALWPGFLWLGALGMRLLRNCGSRRRQVSQLG